MAWIKATGGKSIKEKKYILYNENGRTQTNVGADLMCLSNNIVVGASGKIHIIANLNRFVGLSGYTYNVVFKKNGNTVWTKTFTMDGNNFYEIEDTCNVGDVYSFNVDDVNMKISGYYFID